MWHPRNNTKTILDQHMGPEVGPNLVQQSGMHQAYQYITYHVNRNIYGESKQLEVLTNISDLSIEPNWV